MKKNSQVGVKYILSYRKTHLQLQKQVSLQGEEYELDLLMAETGGKKQSSS